MESATVCRRIVKTGFCLENIIEEIVVTGIPGDLNAKLKEFIKGIVQAFLVLEATLRYFSPRVFADGSVCRGEKRSHLLERFCFSIVLDAHGACDFLIVLISVASFVKSGIFSLRKSSRLVRTSRR